MSSYRLKLLLCLAALTHASTYTLLDAYTPSNFFDGFDFYSGADPTNGFVQYTNATAAALLNLTSITSTSIILRADSTHIYPSTSPGRPSTRLESRAHYTHGLFILSLNHIPHGCGVWPAFWSYGPSWPSKGEIDIIEGVNTNTNNVFAAHTGANCTIAGDEQTGILLSNNCDGSTNGNAGCTVKDINANSYGAEFAAQGGGVYAMEWTSAYIRTWFWAAGDVPASITEGTSTPNPDTFGVPAANFQGSCDIDSHFAEHSFVFDTTFCGDYAGSVYGSTSCPMTKGLDAMGSCVAFVGDNPHAFEEAYWDINSLRVYQAVKGAGSGVSSTSTSLSSVVPAASTAADVSSSVAGAGMGKPTSEVSAGLSTLVIPTSSGSPTASEADVSSTYAGPNTATVALRSGMPQDASVTTSSTSDLKAMATVNIYPSPNTATAALRSGVPQNASITTSSSSNFDPMGTSSPENEPVATITIVTWTTITSCPTPLVCPSTAPTYSHGFHSTPESNTTTSAPDVNTVSTIAALVTMLWNNSIITTTVAPSASVTALISGNLVTTTAGSKEFRRVQPQVPCRQAWCFNLGHGHRVAGLAAGVP